MSGGYELVDGTYVPISGSVEGTATETVYIPRINSMSKVSSPAGGASKGGGGGGGGGGGKKQKHDRLDARGDRYHEVKENLARISENLEEIDKAKTRTYGKNHLKNLEKENELLKKQAAEQ
jgi:archaellum component FlaC